MYRKVLYRVNSGQLMMTACYFVGYEQLCNSGPLIVCLSFGVNIVRARADVVTTKLSIIGANVVRAHERFPCGDRRSGQ